ncbi:hypothetical protein M0Q97_07235 [Candidatus Dojkabacteria bacterium]|jgi:hypothetical protein|nr:hypothetical protein [Candidatus Dojkabacteria bacterium]
MEEFKLFTSENWYIYLLGFITFFATLIEEVANKKKKTKNFWFYLQEFLYTGVAIVAGICLSSSADWTESTSLLVSISLGLVGAPIIKRMRSRKDKIADNIVDSIEDRVKNEIIKGKKKSKDDKNDIINPEDKME